MFRMIFRSQKRFVVFFAVAFCFGMILHVQETRAQTSQHTIDSLTHEELAKYPNGEWLYMRSDAFARRVQYRVEDKLGATRASEHHPSEQRGSAGSKDEVLGQGTGLDISNADGGQEETSIAISRRDPNLIIVGANDEHMGKLQMPAYVSTDAGTSWQTVRLPPNTAYNYYSVGDPVLAPSEDGNIYYTFIAGNAIMVAKTINGFDWIHCTPAYIWTTQDSPDKPSMTVDNSPKSPHFGRVYISWSGFSLYNDTITIKLTWSDDHGQSWSKPTSIFDSLPHFAHVRTGTFGEVYVSFSSYYAPDWSPRHYFATSLDGGLTFRTQTLTPYLEYPRQGSSWASQLKGPTSSRVFPYTTFQVDLARNQIYFVYGSWYLWPNRDSSAVLYRILSNDSGATWSAPVMLGGIGQALHYDRFLPWVAYDTWTNRMSMFYYSSELDKNNFLAWPYRAELIQSGSFAERPLEDPTAGFNVLVCAGFGGPSFLGDYTGSDAYKGEFAAAWTETRKGNTDGDVFVSVSIENSNRVELHRVNAHITLTATTRITEPNTLQVQYQLDGASPANISIYGTRGVRMLTQEITTASITPTESTLNIASLASGNYIVRLTQSGQIVSQPIMIVR
jgi:hypothetical protein